MSTVTNVLFFVCKHAHMQKRKKAEEFRKGCDTDPYQPQRPIRVLGCYLYHICQKIEFISKYVINSVNSGIWFFIWIRTVFDIHHTFKFHQLYNLFILLGLHSAGALKRLVCLSVLPSICHPSVCPSKISCPKHIFHPLGPI